MPAIYANPWHKPADKHSTGPLFRTDATPVSYRGYLIYQRVPGAIGVGVWDVVKDAVCVTQRAGLTGARQAIDELLNH